MPTRRLSAATSPRYEVAAATSSVTCHDVGMAGNTPHHGPQQTHHLHHLSASSQPVSGTVSLSSSMQHRRSTAELSPIDEDRSAVVVPRWEGLIPASGTPLPSLGSATRGTSPPPLHVQHQLLNSGGCRPAHDHPLPKLRWYTMVFICFVSTAGGPFGAESAVRNGGPFFAIASTIITLFIYVLPTVLVVAELSSMMPTNHGYVEWINRAFGEKLSFVASTVQVCAYAIGLSVYPVLARGYIITVFHVSGDAEEYFITLAVMLFAAIPAFLRSSDIGNMAFVCLVLVLAPFAVGVVAGLPTVDTAAWWVVPATIRTTAPTLMSVSVWMYSGFLALGNLAGEVEDHRVFIVGCGGGALLDCLTYLLPLVVALQVPGKWHDGFLASAFDKILPGLGVAILVVSGISGYAMYASSLTCYSRALWGIAEKGWLPSVLTRTNAKTGVPWVAAVAYLVVGSVLIVFDFDFLVTLEQVISAGNYVLFFTAFLVLRYKEPDVARPYRVPGGKLFAWLLVAPPVVLFFALFTSGLTNLVVVFILSMVVVLLLILYVYFIQKRPTTTFTSERNAVRRTNRTHVTLDLTRDDDDMASSSSPSDSELEKVTTVKKINQ